MSSETAQDGLKYLMEPSEVPNIGINQPSTKTWASFTIMQRHKTNLMQICQRQYARPKISVLL